jgi:hypothetical protein
MEMQAFPERIVHFCDRAGPRVAANINQTCAISAKQRRISSRG